MLKNIRLHISKDEEKQSELDEKLADHIIETHKNNINAFQRNIPSLLPYVRTTELANYSVFVNKYAENNIVDFGRGRTLYGFHPEKEVIEQLAAYDKHCPQVLIHEKNTCQFDDVNQVESINELSSFKIRESQPPLPQKVDCLIVFGCGLGLHLSHLLKHHEIKNLIIYEPELQYFQCSVMVTDWQAIFNLAKVNNTAIFLQLNKDGRDLIQDVNELVEHTSINNFHVYKHYNHLVFNSLFQDLSQRSWGQIVETGFSIRSDESYLDYLPSWTPNVDLASHSLVSESYQLFEKNLTAFSKYFPEIHKQFKDYTPKKWLPIVNPDGEINVLKMDSLNTWYGNSPKTDCLTNFENFNQQSTKDGLVLGYKGTKLAHYIHYKFVKETEELLKEAEEEVGALPDTVPSIIMFGLGVGYQLEKLLTSHTVEKLFICEPNRDFFYASLFAIDWQNILETIEKSDARIYLNIGDDGTNLFRDLLNQFYAVGPYILNSTYFYQSYYNASLNAAIGQLREQLQVVISMGEYFDHAYYGIAHTYEGMKRQIPVLSASPADQFSYDEKEVPIFLVGNGPSLDSSIESIKEWQGQAIVVSCGTALQALHRHGITPDFHAEIEQNRSTYDWAVLIGDLDYLKRITLISCNGIHPDTCDLYKDVLIAFKEGESSTVSTTQVIGTENYTLLKNAFPTVSNFACDLFSTMGFTNIYFIGVDLGFVDVKRHHSKLSGYYQKNGDEKYDYALKNNTSLTVPGNFRPEVNTKHEFKVSKQVIEQITQSKPKGQAFYNCSDGARISGTIPLKHNEILIITTEKQKAHTIDRLRSVIFTVYDAEEFKQKFNATFLQDTLLSEIATIESRVDRKFNNKQDIVNIVNAQKEMLFASYENGKSLLFYYLYGTVNYANAVFTKLLSVSGESVNQALVDCQKSWSTTLSKIKDQVSNEKRFELDSSSFNYVERELQLLRMEYNNEALLVVTNCEVFKASVLVVIETDYPWLSNVYFVTSLERESHKEIPEYVIYDSPDIEEKNLIRGRLTTLVLTDNIADKALCYRGITYAKKWILKEGVAERNSVQLAHFSLRFSMGKHKSPIVIFKYRAAEGSAFDNDNVCIASDCYIYYDFVFYLCLYDKNTVIHEIPKIAKGTRGRRGDGLVKTRQLIYGIRSKDVLNQYDKKTSTLINAKMKSYKSK